MFDKLRACKTPTLSTKIDAKAIFLFGLFVEAFLEKKEATSQLFWSAEMFLGGALPRNLTSQKAGIDFVDPQVLVRGHYDLRETFLIVDEAAGFPVNFTVELLQKAGRVLLATTLDGDLVFASLEWDHILWVVCFLAVWDFFLLFIGRRRSRFHQTICDLLPQLESSLCLESVAFPDPALKTASPARPLKAELCPTHRRCCRRATQFW